MTCSIIIPIYNSEKTLDCCLQSVLKENDYIKEIILIDDGSQDGSLHICHKYQSTHSKVRVIHTENRGVSAARNVGISLATGDYIVFVDSDDTLTDSFYVSLSTVKIQGLVIFDFYKKANKTTKYVSISNVIKKSEYAMNSLQYHPRVFGCVWGKLYRTDLIKNNLFNENLSICEDAEFNLRFLSQHIEVLYLPVAMYYYRDSSTIHKYDPQSVSSYLLALDKIYESMKNSNNSFQISACYEFICNAYNVLNIYSIFNSESKVAYRTKCKLANEVRDNPIIVETLHFVKFSNLSFKHFIIAACGKYRLHFILYLISLVSTQKK